MIYCVEDDANIRKLIVYTLESTGFAASGFEDGMSFFEAVSRELPDLVILDIMLPGIDGMEILSKMKQDARMKDIPVIMATAKGTEYDKVQGLDAGADDYITKPFGTEELMARIRTALRHSNRMAVDTVNSNRPYSAKGLVIDFDKRMVSVDEKEVHLTRVEYKIVSILARHSGKVITYSSLIDQVWGPYADDNNRILRVNMANIRRKIEKNPGEPEYIYTELGIGYRMIEDESI